MERPVVLPVIKPPTSLVIADTAEDSDSLGLEVVVLPFTTATRC